jgi:hypothetical protein
MHTLHDGSVVRVIGARELIAIPIWKGNRNINSDHVRKIKLAVGENVRQLDSIYRLVQTDVIDAGGHPCTETYLIDGQHRCQVLKDHFANNLCESDFPVLVIEKKVASELEIIHYFNTINTVNPITWSDPNLLVNMYISELEKTFNTKKMLFIRPGSTKRPYLMVEKLREVLSANVRSLKSRTEDAVLFVQRCKDWNDQQIAQADIISMGYRKSEADILLKSAKAGFMLAMDSKLPWIMKLL